MQRQAGGPAAMYEMHILLRGHLALQPPVFIAIASCPLPQSVPLTFCSCSSLICGELYVAKQS